jgi:hypothetical protein
MSQRTSVSLRVGAALWPVTADNRVLDCASDTPAHDSAGDDEVAAVS